jgi:hypothetical protein
MACNGMRCHHLEARNADLYGNTTFRLVTLHFDIGGTFPVFRPLMVGQYRPRKKAVRVSEKLGVFITGGWVKRVRCIEVRNILLFSDATAEVLHPAQSVMLLVERSVRRRLL